MRIKRLLQFLLAAFIFALLGIFTLDFWITANSKGRVFFSTEEVPKRKIGLVLGTSKYIGRTLNLYYSYRIQAAEQLYNDKKIAMLLLSGDNAHRSYNEPWTMKRDMLKAGVPEEKIVLDYAGFRTLDSVVRAKKVFDAKELVFITQAFHCERALFIADHVEIDAICLAVPSPQGMGGYKIRLREIFARVKAVLDLHILNKQPKFLGPKETIEFIEELAE